MSKGVVELILPTIAETTRLPSGCVTLYVTRRPMTKKVQIFVFLLMEILPHIESNFFSIEFNGIDEILSFA